MERVTFEMTDAVEMKVNGTVLVVNPHKVDGSWLAEMLAYGIRRKVNDTYSGETGGTKFDLCAAMVKELNEGKVWEGRTRRAAVTMDTAERLAFDAARADLTRVFKARTKLTKLADMADADPAVGKFLTVGTDGKATWDNAVVMAWVEKQREAGKKDYLAEARETLALADSMGDELDI